MLARKNRLKKKKDFEKVLKAGKGLKEGSLILKFIPNNLKESRLGIIISQKVSKKATVRNKIKRRIKFLFKSRLLKIKKGVDLVLIVSPGFETKDFPEIEGIINKLFNKAKLIN